MSILAPLSAPIPAKIALLVDGENLSVTEAGLIILRAAQIGTQTVRRVYGNALRVPGWTTAPGFRFVQTGSGKNAADMALTVDAMDLAHQGFDTLILASSDGDFTYLATSLRERGLFVIGIGEAKAPEPFRKACSRFIDISRAPVAKPALLPTAPSAKTAPQGDTLLNLVRDALNDHGGELRLTDLNVQMRVRHDVKISTLPDKNWRSYLTRHPASFSCDPRGTEAKVRLIPEVC